MVRRPTGQLAGQPVGRNRLKGQAFGSVPFAFTKAYHRARGFDHSLALKLATQARNLAHHSSSSSQSRCCAALRAESLWLSGDV